MNTKKVTIIVIAVFYIILLGFTISARRMHVASLPRVEVINLDYEKFAKDETDNKTGDEASGDKGSKEKESNLFQINYNLQLGIPKQLVDKQKVFILSSKNINGEERVIAKEVTNLEIGQSNDTCYEVINGISGMDQVIISGQERLKDGCEVYVED